MCISSYFIVFHHTYLGAGLAGGEFTFKPFLRISSRLFFSMAEMAERVVMDFEELRLALLAVRISPADFFVAVMLRRLAGLAPSFFLTPLVLGGVASLDERDGSGGGSGGGDDRSINFDADLPGLLLFDACALLSNDFAIFFTELERPSFWRDLSSSRISCRFPDFLADFFADLKISLLTSSKADSA